MELRKTENIPDEFKDEAKQAAKQKADQKRKNVVEECVTMPSQMVPEKSSSGNTAIFESKHEHDPLQVAHTMLKEKDDEIHRLRQELEQEKHKQELETFPTIDAIPHNPQIDQEKS